MAICTECGCEFNLTSAKKSINRRYGAGTYDEYCPGGDVCASCIDDVVSCDVATGEEIKELMGPDWDWDDE